MNKDNDYRTYEQIKKSIEFFERRFVLQCICTICTLAITIFCITMTFLYFYSPQRDVLIFSISIVSLISLGISVYFCIIDGRVLFSLKRLYRESVCYINMAKSIYKSIYKQCDLRNEDLFPEYEQSDDNDDEDNDDGSSLFS